jgi:carbonic anhydrase
MNRFFFLCALCFAATSYAGESLERLKQGHERFLKNELKLCFDVNQPRLATVDQQKPFATILGCSDSRVPPEILFDQTIGDLFVVRVAGNVAGPVELDSIDYSALVLGSSLVLVLGHENCGAVKAVMAKQTAGIEAVADRISPYIVNPKGGAPLTTEQAIKENIRHVVDEVAKSSEISKLIKEGKIEVAGAYYSVSTGKVEFLQ